MPGLGLGHIASIMSPILICVNGVKTPSPPSDAIEVD